jgi:hypothetical protein
MSLFDVKWSKSGNLTFVSIRVVLFYLPAIVPPTDGWLTWKLMGWLGQLWIDWEATINLGAYDHNNKQQQRYNDETTPTNDERNWKMAAVMMMMNGMAVATTFCTMKCGIVMMIQIVNVGNGVDITMMAMTTTGRTKMTTTKNMIWKPSTTAASRINRSYTSNGILENRLHHLIII